MMSMLKNNNEQKSLSVQMAVLHQRWQQIRQMEEQVDQMDLPHEECRSHLSLAERLELYSTV